MSDDDQKKIRDEFHDAVNMTASELEKFLETDASQDVGQKKDGGRKGKAAESTGHESGRRIVEILGRKQADLTDDDYDQMKRTTSYVHRHLAQKPDKSMSELEDTKWRYSLMNWGHDPLK